MGVVLRRCSPCQDDKTVTRLSPDAGRDLGTQLQAQRATTLRTVSKFGTRSPDSAL